MATKSPPPPCVGAPSFNPNVAITDAHTEAYAQALLLLDKNDFAGAIRAYFGIAPTDTYVYHAITSVTLPQVQHVVDLGGKNGLHAWYWTTSASSPPLPLEPPPPSDIDAYISLFALGSNPSSALRSFAANAKRNSLRASIAAHLTANRYIHPGAASLLGGSGSSSSKKKKKNKNPLPSPTTPTVNPYYDFWAWSTRNLEWAGPSHESEARPQSHHILPILMHHFGCAVPSPEALSILTTLAEGRPILDMGSGNGYWTFVLRHHTSNLTVVPIDNAQSAWRVNWVSDTTVTDAARYLARNAGGAHAVLLMVYPVVGGGAGGGVEGGFTRGLMAAYKGDTVAVVGTQNGNGYTSFREMTFAEYMTREQPDWTKILQVPLPSFAGKDEALFVYQRGERAARLEATNVL